jgi:hypothetical protein
VLGGTGLGIFVGHRVRHLSGTLTEPFGVLQAAMLGVVGLILAFGLSLAVTRYENRRSAIVDEANAIGTTFLRAQTLSEPQRSKSIVLLDRYIDSTIRLSEVIPSSDQQRTVAAEEDGLQRQLWGLAGQALDGAPQASAPRLYVETLNEMIDNESARIAGLNNRVPNAVLLLEVLGATLALGLLGAYLTLLGRGLAAVMLASALVAFLLLVTFDLDRPTRGMIRVPDTPLTNQRESMQLPPAAGPPLRP